MPSLIDWNDPRVVKLIDSYIEFDHVPPRFQVGTHPKSMKELGSRIEALFGNTVSIKYSSLQYQIPRRRRQLWLQFNPVTCPEPHVTIGQGPHPFKEHMCKIRKEKDIDLAKKRVSLKSPISHAHPSTPVNCPSAVQVGQGDVRTDRFSTDGFDQSAFSAPSNTSFSDSSKADSAELNPPPKEVFAEIPDSNKRHDNKRPFCRVLSTESEDMSALQPKAKLLKQSDIADSVNRLFEQPGPLNVSCPAKFTAYKFTIALNSKLDKKLYVIPIDESSVKTYTFNKFDNGITYLKCNGCNATAKIERNKDYILAKPHTTACKSTKTKDAYVDEQAGRYARQLALQGDTISDAYRKAFVAVRHAGFGNCYKLYGSVKTQLSRWAGKSATTEPTTLIQGQRWLLNKTDNTEVYITDNGARALASCKIAVADATFGTSPRGEYQVLTVHALTPNREDQEEYSPVMFALMKNKLESSYDEVFQAVQKLWNELGVECKIQRWHTDYEKALMEASKRLVGESAVFGCLFHFSQAVLKKLKPMVNAKRGCQQVQRLIRLYGWQRRILSRLPSSSTSTLLFSMALLGIFVI